MTCTGRAVVRDEFTRREDALRREIRSLRNELDRTRRQTQRELGSLRAELRRVDSAAVLASGSRSLVASGCWYEPPIMSSGTRRAIRSQAFTLGVTMFLSVGVIFVAMLLLMA